MVQPAASGYEVVVGGYTSFSGCRGGCTADFTISRYGRYKSFPVEDDIYFRTLLRYVEANPLKAKLVPRAQDWEWSSLGCPRSVSAKVLDPWPVERPRDWSALVNRPLKETERRRVLDSVERGRPLGSDSWTRQMAGRLGLQYTLNPRGRPRKPTPETQK